MNLLVLNIALALAWSALLGGFSVLSLTIGFAVSFAAMWVVRPLFGSTRYFERLGRVVALIGFFLYELVVSSLRVVWEVITPPFYSRPGIVAVPLDARTDFEIMTLANLISLTPGTLSLDVSEDRRTLYVHAMFIDDPDALRREIKQGMERRVLEALR